MKKVIDITPLENRGVNQVLDSVKEDCADDVLVIYYNKDDMVCAQSNGMSKKSVIFLLESLKLSLLLE